MNNYVNTNTISNQIKARIQAVLGGKLTVPQWEVLKALSQGSMTAGTLARETGTLMPSVSRMIEALKNKKLIKKERPTCDRREVVVSLTAKGKALHDRFINRVTSADALTDAEVIHFKVMGELC